MASKIGGFFADFKKFAMRGNVIDLAVGVIIGAAFGTVTKSMVDDVIMPPLGLAIGKVDFKELYVPLDRAWLESAIKEGGSMPPLAKAQEAGVATLRYGMFINTIINFIFVAFGVFLLVKLMMKLQRQAPPPPPTPAELTTSEKLLTEIRDSLRGKPTELAGSPKTGPAPPR
jgi:large conductance mechanosensitive channel